MAVMNLPFTFPAPLEPFIAYQEQIINRPLTEAEKKITAAWLEIINQAEPGDIQIVNELIAQHTGNTGITRFLTAVKKWMMEAVTWKQGKNC